MRLSRRTITLLLALVLTLASACVDAARTQLAPTSGSATATSSASSDATGAASDAGGAGGGAASSGIAGRFLPAVVNKPVDGDTVHVLLADGTEEKVRFIGVDTPESTIQHEPYGKEASAFTKRELLGKRVWLQLDVGERDRYGRLLAYVWTEKPTRIDAMQVRERMFNARLLAEGYAQIMTVPPNVAYVDYFRPIQADARRANRGLWALPAEDR